MLSISSWAALPPPHPQKTPSLHAWQPVHVHLVTEGGGKLLETGGSQVAI